MISASNFLKSLMSFAIKPIFYIYFLFCNKNIQFDDKLKIRDVRYDNMTKYNSFDIYHTKHITMLKNGPFQSNRRFKKGAWVAKSIIFLLRSRLFLHTFCQKRTFGSHANLY